MTELLNQALLLKDLPNIATWQNELAMSWLGNHFVMEWKSTDFMVTTKVDRLLLYCGMSRERVSQGTRILVLNIFMY